MAKNTVLAVCHWEGKQKIMAAAVGEHTRSQSVVTKYTLVETMLTNCTWLTVAYEGYDPDLLHLHKT